MLNREAVGNAPSTNARTFTNPWLASVVTAASVVTRVLVKARFQPERVLGRAALLFSGPVEVASRPQRWVQAHLLRSREIEIANAIKSMSHFGKSTAMRFTTTRFKTYGSIHEAITIPNN